MQLQFILEKNNQIVLKENCGNSRYEIETMAAVMKIHARQIQKHDNWQIYYIIKSKV